MEPTSVQHENVTKVQDVWGYLDVDSTQEALQGVIRTIGLVGDTRPQLRTIVKDDKSRGAADWDHW